MATPLKAFDAVASSRQWRETTSRKLDAMSRAERLAHYASLMKQVTGVATASATAVMKAYVELGMEPAGISMLTNWAAGLRPQTLHHVEVVEVGKTASLYPARLLKAVV